MQQPTTQQLRGELNQTPPAGRVTTSTLQIEAGLQRNQEGVQGPMSLETNQLGQHVPIKNASQQEVDLQYQKHLLAENVLLPFIDVKKDNRFAESHSFVKAQSIRLEIYDEYFAKPLAKTSVRLPPQVTVECLDVLVCQTVNLHGVDIRYYQFVPRLSQEPGNPTDYEIRDIYSHQVLSTLKTMEKFLRIYACVTKNIVHQRVPSSLISKSVLMTTKLKELKRQKMEVPTKTLKILETAMFQMINKMGWAHDLELQVENFKKWQKTQYAKKVIDSGQLIVEIQPQDYQEAQQNSPSFKQITNQLNQQMQIKEQDPEKQLVLGYFQQIGLYKPQGDAIIQPTQMQQEEVGNMSFNKALTFSFAQKEEEKAPSQLEIGERVLQNLKPRDKGYKHPIIIQAAQLDRDAFPRLFQTLCLQPVRRNAEAYFGFLNAFFVGVEADYVQSQWQYSMQYMGKSFTRGAQTKKAAQKQLVDIMMMSARPTNMEWWQSLTQQFIGKGYLGMGPTAVFWIYLDIEMIGEHISESGALLATTLKKSLQFVDGKYFASTQEHALADYLYRIETACKNKKVAFYYVCKDANIERRYLEANGLQTHIIDIGTGRLAWFPDNQTAMATDLGLPKDHNPMQDILLWFSIMKYSFDVNKEGREGFAKISHPYTDFDIAPNGVVKEVRTLGARTRNNTTFRSSRGQAFRDAKQHEQYNKKQAKVAADIKDAHERANTTKSRFVEKYVPKSKKPAPKTDSNSETEEEKEPKFILKPGQQLIKTSNHSVFPNTFAHVKEGVFKTATAKVERYGQFPMALHKPLFGDDFYTEQPITVGTATIVVKPAKCTIGTGSWQKMTDNKKQVVKMIDCYGNMHQCWLVAISMVLYPYVKSPTKQAMAIMIFSYYIDDRLAMDALMDRVVNLIDADIMTIIESRYQDISIVNIARNKRQARYLFVILMGEWKQNRKVNLSTACWFLSYIGVSICQSHDNPILNTIGLNGVNPVDVEVENRDLVVITQTDATEFHVYLNVFGTCTRFQSFDVNPILGKNDAVYLAGYKDNIIGADTVMQVAVKSVDGADRFQIPYVTYMSENPQLPVLLVNDTSGITYTVDTPIYVTMSKNAPIQYPGIFSIEPYKSPKKQQPESKVQQSQKKKVLKEISLDNLIKPAKKIVTTGDTTQKETIIENRPQKPDINLAIADIKGDHDPIKNNKPILKDVKEKTVTQIVTDGMIDVGLEIGKVAGKCAIQGTAIATGLMFDATLETAKIFGNTVAGGVKKLCQRQGNVDDDEYGGELEEGKNQGQMVGDQEEQQDYNQQQYDYQHRKLICPLIDHFVDNKQMVHEALTLVGYDKFREAVYLDRKFQNINVVRNDYWFYVYHAILSEAESHRNATLVLCNIDLRWVKRNAPKLPFTTIIVLPSISMVEYSAALQSNISKAQYLQLLVGINASVLANNQFGQIQNIVYSARWSSIRQFVKQSAQTEYLMFTNTKLLPNVINELDQVFPDQGKGLDIRCIGFYGYRAKNTTLAQYSAPNSWKNTFSIKMNQEYVNVGEYGHTRTTYYIDIPFDQDTYFAKLQYAGVTSGFTFAPISIITDARLTSQVYNHLFGDEYQLISACQYVPLMKIGLFNFNYRDYNHIKTRTLGFNLQLVQNPIDTGINMIEEVTSNTSDFQVWTNYKKAQNEGSTLTMKDTINALTYSQQTDITPQQFEMVQSQQFLDQQNETNEGFSQLHPSDQQMIRLLDARARKQVLQDYDYECKIDEDTFGDFMRYEQSWLRRLFSKCNKGVGRFNKKHNVKRKINLLSKLMTMIYIPLVILVAFYGATYDYQQASQDTRGQEGQSRTQGQQQQAGPKTKYYDTYTFVDLLGQSRPVKEKLFTMMVQYELWFISTQVVLYPGQCFLRHMDTKVSCNYYEQALKIQAQMQGRYGRQAQAENNWIQVARVPQYNYSQKQHQYYHEQWKQYQKYHQQGKWQQEPRKTDESFQEFIMQLSIILSGYLMIFLIRYMTRDVGRLVRIIRIQGVLQTYYINRAYLLAELQELDTRGIRRQLYFGTNEIERTLGGSTTRTFWERLQDMISYYRTNLKIVHKNFQSQFPALKRSFLEKLPQPSFFLPDWGFRGEFKCYDLNGNEKSAEEIYQTKNHCIKDQNIYRVGNEFPKPYFTPLDHKSLVSAIKNRQCSARVKPAKFNIGVFRDYVTAWLKEHQQQFLADLKQDDYTILDYINNAIGQKKMRYANALSRMKDNIRTRPIYRAMLKRNEPQCGETYGLGIDGKPTKPQVNVRPRCIITLDDMSNLLVSYANIRLIRAAKKSVHGFIHGLNSEQLSAKISERGARTFISIDGSQHDAHIDQELINIVHGRFAQLVYPILQDELQGEISPACFKLLKRVLFDQKIKLRAYYPQFPKQKGFNKMKLLIKGTLHGTIKSGVSTLTTFTNTLVCKFMVESHTMFLLTQSGHALNVPQVEDLVGGLFGGDDQLLCTKSEYVQTVSDAIKMFSVAKEESTIHGLGYVIKAHYISDKIFTIFSKIGYRLGNNVVMSRQFGRAVETGNYSIKNPGQYMTRQQFDYGIYSQLKEQVAHVAWFDEFLLSKAATPQQETDWASYDPEVEFKLKMDTAQGDKHLPMIGFNQRMPYMEQPRCIQPSTFS